VGTPLSAEMPAPVKTAIGASSIVCASTNDEGRTTKSNLRHSSSIIRPASVVARRYS
jgi:hypothetical protein